jgi:hypothetical protein
LEYLKASSRPDALEARAAAVSAAAGAALAATETTATGAAKSTAATETATSAAALTTAGTTATTARPTSATRTASCGCGLARQKTFALQLLAGKLAGAAYSLGLLAGSFFGWLLKMAAELHLAENALTLQLFLERLEGLINIVVANENLQAVVSSEEFCLMNAQSHRRRRFCRRCPRFF